MEQESPAEFTRRAVLTGMVLGAALTPCNVYSGLKIGWSFNMSIAAGLLAVGAWRLAERSLGTAPLGLKENNINQTAASASASIVSGGLVAPIPALTLLTGQTLQWPVLAFWVFCVSILGVVVAAGLRR
ncbi:MAG TPA: peptide transporter, partial [Rhodospirillaceae bacterium]|nr:peptide transporter [Rhodospirillaceae bacterium]